MVPVTPPGQFLIVPDDGSADGGDRDSPGGAGGAGAMWVVMVVVWAMWVVL